MLSPFDGSYIQTRPKPVQLLHEVVPIVTQLHHGEFVAAQIFPDILERVQFWSVGRAAGGCRVERRVALRRDSLQRRSRRNRRASGRLPTEIRADVLPVRPVLTTNETARRFTPAAFLPRRFVHLRFGRAKGLQLAVWLGSPTGVVRQSSRVGPLPRVTMRREGAGSRRRVCL